jgi:hypothetical protein
MADNVQGFNHLDEVLMHLGDQFRQDALRQQMMKNQKDIAGIKAGAHARLGIYDNKPFAFLQKQLMDMNSLHRTFVTNTINSSKDVTGVPQMSEADAEGVWAKSDYGQQEQELNGEVMKQLGKMNPGLGRDQAPKGQPGQSGAAALPDNFGQSLDGSTLFGK